MIIFKQIVWETEICHLISVGPVDIDLLIKKIDQ